ncbi:MAG: sigma-54-dependent Fis family transcriptional regulator [Pseudomonadota bacterium]|nr:sigma-54-dependent Fis family transcriptional regulator [Pseudomonadota bacterium]
MAARLDGALEARRILERQGHLADGLLDGPLSASWQRCLAAGLDPWQAPDIPTIDVGELRSRGEHSQRVARLARIEMESLFHQIAGSNFMIAFGDPEGVVIDTISDPIFAVSDAGRQIRAGTVWSESVAGTNATGTATATGQGLIVHGAEHFFSCFDGITCAAAPIQYADGSLAGVLDASSFCDAYPSHTLVLVRMAALNVANGLFRGEMHGHFIVELHARPEFLGSIAAGMLAVDRDGVLRGVSSQAPALMPGVQLRAGMAFDELFTEDFGVVLERLRREGRTRVFDPLDRAYAMALRDPVQVRTHAAARTPDAVRAGDRQLRPGEPVAPALAPGGMAAGLPGAAAGRLVRGPAAAVPDHVKGELPDLVCQDPRVQECLRLVEAAVRLPAPVLITGETGTGKEMLARYAHRISGRRGELVAVNCAAMPAELFEAELFGYSAGAFTGARREGHGGLILEADGGTLLLDEIADLPPPLQAALLRFLDDFQVRPVGGRVSRVVDTLVIAATNADLHRAVAERRFRADLLYRLNTVQVVLPPLRERSDLAAVARVVLARIDPHARISAGALQALAAHDWPGNVRELRAVLTRARLMAEAAEIEVRHLGLQMPPAAAAMSGRSESGQVAGTLRTLNGELVRRTCAELDGNVSATAQRLAISRTTVYRYLREAGHG